MQQEDAVGIVRGFLEAHGLNQDPSDLAEDQEDEETREWEPDITFQILPEDGTLKCWALIHQFSEPPSDTLLQAGEAEAASHAPLGGGALEYDPEDQGLYLTRTYRDRVTLETLETDLRALQDASDLWAEEILDRVFDRAYAA